MGEFCLLRGPEGCLLSMRPTHDGRIALRFCMGAAVHCTPATLEVVLMGLTAHIAGNGTWCSVARDGNCLRLQVITGATVHTYELEMARLEAALTLLSARRSDTQLAVTHV